MSKLVYGFGVNDLKEYKTQKYELCPFSGKHRRVWICPYYKTWKNMITRCYAGQSVKKYPTYLACSVCEEWKYFSNFKAWMETQNWEGRHLDKDILVKGNKIYAPEKCCFVPPAINTLFVNRKTLRGQFPVGVHKHYSGKFVSNCSAEFLGKRKFYGKLRNTPKEAFYDYKEYKEQVIKQVADFYKDEIDPKVYEALVNYQVEITD